MGFFTKIANIFLTEDNEVKKENSIYDIEFQNSMIVDFAEIRQKILSMKIYYPEKAKEIEDKIISLENYIEKNVEMDEESQNYIKQTYQEIKENFENFNKISEEKFLFSETKRIYKELDKIFCGEIDVNDENDTTKIVELENLLINLEEKKTQFTGIKQQQYISSIIKAKYRLKCCRMLLAEQDEGNYFEETPKIEKIFYANIFTKDIEEMYKQIGIMKARYSLAKMDISLETEETKLDELVTRVQEEYTDKNNGLITEIFDDKYDMSKYIEIRKNLRNRVVNFSKDIENKQAEIAKKEQEQKDAKVRKEKLLEQRSKYKNLTEEEQQNLLKEIDTKKFDVTTSYKQIIMAERRIAEAKGLLNEKSGMSSDDIEFIRSSKEQVYEYLLDAKDKGITISFLPDIDENKRKDILVAKTKGKNLKTNISIDIDDEVYEKTRLYNYKFNRSFIKFMQNKGIARNTGFSGNLYAYSWPSLKGQVNREIETAYKQILDEKSNKVDEIKFYIEMPYLRPMIPILEKLKKEEIEYYIPPVDEEICKYEPTKKIYIDGIYLEKYKEKVHSQISNPEKGVIVIGGENITEADLILGDLKEHLQEIIK